MKRIVFTASLTVLAFAVAIQAQTPLQTQTASVEQELTKLENAWLQAFFTKDTAFSDRFLADDYVGTDEHGNVKTKAQEIAEIKAGAHLSTSGAQDNIKVRVFGNTALVTGRNIMKGLFKGKEYSSPYLWTHTFLKRGGRWQCVASHVSKPLPQQTSGSVEQELIKLENEWADAWVKSDVVFFDRIMADDYTWTSPWGEVITKAHNLALVRSGEDVITSWVLAEMKVRVYGDAAVVTGRSTVKETYKGEDVSVQERWTHTWVNRAGRWQCVAGHSSEIAQK